MISGSIACRERVVIVDRNLDFGLKLADYLASSGYHAVLGRSLDAILHDLSEMQPDAILLSPGLWDQGIAGNETETLRTVKALCPEAPVISVMKPVHDTSTGLRSKRGASGNCAEPSKINRVEELLRTQLGIPCARVF
jgi:DNA-binding NtrC family response regulator